MGGTPPRPPGYVPPGLPDVSAGSVNIFRGRLVIVFGPAGTVSGIFVYQSGTTPGPGNTPIVAITNSTTDPYGNTVQPTIQITGTGTLNVGSSPNPQVQLAAGGGVGVVNFLLNNAAFVDGQLVNGIVGGTFAAQSVQGPGRSAAGFRDRCRIQLNSSDGIASFANIQYVYNSDGGVDQVFMFEDAAGVGIRVCQQITAADPSVVATSAAPAIAETWHDMRPLSNAFIGSILNQYPPQFRKLADGNVQVAGYVQLPNNAGNLNGIIFANVPAAYRPGSNNGHKWTVEFSNNVAPVGTPNVQVDTGGNLTFRNMPVAGMANNISNIGGIYPLDNTGLILS